MTWVDGSIFAIDSAMSDPVTPTSSMKDAMKLSMAFHYWSTRVINPWIKQKMTDARVVKWCIEISATHQRRGGVEVGYFNSIWTSNCGRWILNELMTFSIESQWLTTRRHIVCIFAIRFYYRVKWVINPIMIEKNRSLMTLLIMSSITRSNWCTPHQIQIREQSLCIAVLRRMTTPTTCLVILQASSDIKPKRWIVQLGHSIVKNLFTIVDMISPVWRSNIESAHPCKLTMEW